MRVQLVAEASASVLPTTLLSPDCRMLDSLGEGFLDNKILPDPLGAPTQPIPATSPSTKAALTRLLSPHMTMGLLPALPAPISSSKLPIFSLQMPGKMLSRTDRAEHVPAIRVQPPTPARHPPSNPISVPDPTQSLRPDVTPPQPLGSAPDIDLLRPPPSNPSYHPAAVSPPTGPCSAPGGPQQFDFHFLESPTGPSSAIENRLTSPNSPVT